MEHNNNYSPESKVWIYQSSRPFTPEEIIQINNELRVFARQWTAHNEQLHALGKVIEDRFILLMVDETHTNASGCSIDGSVHFIKSIEKKLDINLFDRLIFNYEDNGQLFTARLDELGQLVHRNSIHSETLVFDPLVKTKKELEENFKIPLKKSWIKDFAGIQD